jgi:hypothetical protein
MAPGGATALKLLGEYGVSVKLHRELTATSRFELRVKPKARRAPPRSVRNILSRRRGRAAHRALNTCDCLRRRNGVVDRKTHLIRPTVNVPRQIVIVRHLPNAAATTIIGRALPQIQRPAHGVVTIDRSRLKRAFGIQRGRVARPARAFL